MTSTRLLEGDGSSPSTVASALARKLALGVSTLGLVNGLPTLASTPPTTTTSSSFTNIAGALSGSSISSVRNIPTIIPSTASSTKPQLNKSAFTWFGQPASQKSQANGNSQGSAVSYGVSGLSNGPFRVEFMVDCSQLELVLLGNGGQYRIWVNGQLVTQRAVNGPTADSNLYNVLVSFGSRATRRITLDLTSAQGFLGVNLGPTDSVWPSPDPVGPRLLVLGDSFVDGANGVGGIDTWAFTLGLLLGCRDVQASGIGGTGFVITGGGQTSSQTKINYRPRLQADVISHVPDIVVIQGSVNDPNNSVSTPALIAEAAAVYASIRQALPKAKLIATGIMRTAGSLTGSQAFANDAIRKTALAPGATDLFVDAWPDYYVGTVSSLSRNWFAGTGNTGSTAGNGNADLYMSNDGTHPSQAGHDYLALRVASEIAKSGLLI